MPAFPSRYPDVLGEILTAMATPFKADGSVNIEAFRGPSRRTSLLNGSDGLVVTVRTGEAPDALG